MLTFSLTFKAKFGCLDIVLPLQDFNNRKTNGFSKHTHTHLRWHTHTHTHTRQDTDLRMFYFSLFWLLDISYSALLCQHLRQICSFSQKHFLTLRFPRSWTTRDFKTRKNKNKLFLLYSAHCSSYAQYISYRFFFFKHSWTNPYV